MSPEYLVADLDGRWSEQKEVQGQSHVITESDPLQMVRQMEALRPSLQGKVGTVTFDSGTAVMDYLQAKGRLMEAQAREQKQKFNLNDVHRLKADTMRVPETGSAQVALRRIVDLPHRAEHGERQDQAAHDHLGNRAGPHEGQPQRCADDRH